MKQITVNDKTYKTDGNWYEIEHVYDDCDDELISGFTYNGQWHALDNYIKTSNNAWNNEPEHYEAGLHARDMTSYYKPDYVELDSSGEAVRVWKEV